MAVFTERSLEDAAAFVTSLGLGQVQSIAPGDGGIENTVYVIDTRGSAYVLTLFGRMSSAQLPFHLHLMRHLAERGTPVSYPVADANGELLHVLNGRPASLVKKLRGASDMAPMLTHCYAVGDMLARMHLAGADYPRFQSNHHGLAWCNDTVAALLPQVAGDQRTLMTDELSLQHRIAMSTACRDLPQGVVHARLCRANVLFDDGELSGFLDFHFAGIDALIYDIGVCLNDWCVHPATGRDDADSISTFLNAYQAVRKLTPQEVELLPALRRAAALRFWLSQLHDLHLPRQAGIVKLHSSRHFERMLRALRANHPQD